MAASHVQLRQEDCVQHCDRCGDDEKNAEKATAIGDIQATISTLQRLYLKSMQELSFSSNVEDIVSARGHFGDDGHCGWVL